MKVRSVSRSRRWGTGLAALAMSTILLVGAGLSASPAYAKNYPTWDDVVAADNNEAAAAAKVTEIKNFLTDLETELIQLQDASAVAAAESKDAEEAFLRADEKANALEAQAEASRVEAERTADQAATLVSQMYRSGGVDRNMELFLGAEEGTADVLLERLAMMGKATERNTSIAEDAQLAQNTAESLGAQAEAARTERERLSAEKEAKAQTAALAVEETRAQYEANLAKQVELKDMLAALEDTSATTAAEYREGVAYRAEQKRLADIAAQKAAEAAAAENAANNGGGGGSGGGASAGGGGGGGGSGWARPVGGYVSQPYWGIHTGADIASGWGSPIVATTSGTIVHSGWMDNYGGIMVYINHAGGIQSRYAHLSSTAVGYGQWVNAGQIIGYVGSTGMSTGPHLHFEILSGGGFIDPLWFLGQRGIGW